MGMNWPWLTTGIDADGAADVFGARAWVSTVAAAEWTAGFCEPVVALAVLLTAVAAKAVAAEPESFVAFRAADAGLALGVECVAGLLALLGALEFWLCETPLLPALELSSA